MQKTDLESRFRYPGKSSYRNIDVRSQALNRGMEAENKREEINRKENYLGQEINIRDQSLMTLITYLNMSSPLAYKIPRRHQYLVLCLTPSRREAVIY